MSVKDRCNVFQDDELWSYQANDSEQLIEQAGTGVMSKATAGTRFRQVLAGEATDHNVGCSTFRVEGGDVIVNRNGGPVLC
jgi:hypothetical protein